MTTTKAESVPELTDIECTGIILAGGAASRLGGVNKALLTYQQLPLIVHVAKQFPDQWRVLVASHDNSADFERLGFNCVEDASMEHYGPMEAIRHIAAYVGTEYCAVSACDTPLIPPIVHQYLYAALTADHHAAYAASDTRAHFCCAIFRTSELHAIKEETKSMRHLLTLLNANAVATELAEQLFVNINTPEDWRRLTQQTP